MSGPMALPPRKDGVDGLAGRRRPSWALPDRAPEPGAAPRRRRPSWARAEPESAPAPRRPRPTTCPRTPGGGTRPAGRRPDLRPARPRDPVDALAADLAEDIGAAVHAYEVAAVLESQGMTGERIQREYGHRDLFSLAAALYQRVPRDHPEPPLPPDPWRPDHAGCALRGLLFALPGTAYLLAAGAWGDQGPHALIAAALVSWAWSQALSHRAYVRLVTGRHEAARTLLRGSTAGVGCASLTGLAVAGPGPAAVFAAGQSCYLAAAGVLLVLGRERQLAGALLPVAAGAAALPWWDPPAALGLGLPVLTVLLAAGAAGLALRAALATAPAAGAPPRLVRSVPYGLFGLAAGTLVTAAGARDPYAVIVLTLSMGPAEWLLYRFRGLAVAALRASTTPLGFRLRAVRALGLCVAAYLASLAPGIPLTDASPAPLLALGAALWTALLLQAFGVAWPSAALCLGAAAAATALPRLTDLPASTAQLVGCTAAALALFAAAVRHLGSPTAHS
ncbi:hypothetical protein AB0I46_05210 [Streptomyces spectabilis]|uniref:hypothetical protein n=1 Tax=Streptomyces spectabilis TaxID=68270 RepID=UPI0033F8405A